MNELRESLRVDLLRRQSVRKEVATSVVDVRTRVEVERALVHTPQDGRRRLAGRIREAVYRVRGEVDRALEQRKRWWHSSEEVEQSRDRVGDVDTPIVIRFQCIEAWWRLWRQEELGECKNRIGKSDLTVRVRVAPEKQSRSFEGGRVEHRGRRRHSRARFAEPRTDDSSPSNCP